MKKSIKNFAVLLVSATMLAGCGETKPETYKVKFVSEGQTMYETTVGKGSVVDYKGITPTKEADENNKAYTFAGWKNGENLWNLATDVVNADTTLTAYFNATARGSFTVSLVDDDGTTSLGSVSVKEGFAATKPEDPAKQGDAQFKYTFKGWMLNDAAYDWSLPVNSNLTLKASWQKEVQKYDIKFMNGGVPVKAENLEYGATIVAPQDDLTHDKDGYHYKFLGWTKEGSTDVVTNFGTVTGHATYNAKFDTPELIKYTATIKFDYEGGPSDSEIEFDATNRADKLLEIKDLLPDSDEDTIYEWKEALPEVLPFEDCKFTIIANCKYYSIDMSGSELNSNLKFFDRGGKGGSLAISDSAMKFNSFNDVFFSTRSYTSFEFEANIKSNLDVFSFVLGATKDNAVNGYSEGHAGNATNGRCFFVIKPSHASSRVRLFAEGAEAKQFPKTADVSPSYIEGFKLRISAYERNIDIYLDDELEVSCSLTEAQYTPGGYIGIFSSNKAEETPSTMEFSSFSISKFDVPNKTFSTSFADNKLPGSLKYVHNAANGGYSITDNVLTAGFGYNADGTADFLTSFHKYKTFDLEMTIKLDANGGADARVNLDFGMPGMAANTNHGSNTIGECIMLVPSGQGARWYAAGSKTRNDPAFDISKIASQFMTIKLSVSESSYSISVDGGAAVTLNSAFNGAEGYILLTTNSDRQTSKVSISSLSITDTSAK